MRGLGLALCAGLGVIGAAAADTRVPLSVWINGVDKGVHRVWMDENGEVCLPRRLLESWGVAPWRALEAHRDCLPLTGDPRVRAHLVVTRATLRLTLDPRLLRATVRQGDRPRRRPAPWVDSAFLNYALTHERTDGGDARRLAIEGVVNSHGGTLEHQRRFRAEAGGPLRPGPGRTRWVYDQPEHLRRWELGQVVAPGGALRAPLSLRGAGVARHWEMDPGALRYDGFQVTGLAERPSTVEVWLDGRLLRREVVPPGPFVLRGLPAGAGRRLGQVVIRDDFGGERRLPLSVYVPGRILPPHREAYACYLGTWEGDGRSRLSLAYARAIRRGLQLGGWVIAAEDRYTLGGQWGLVPAGLGELHLEGAVGRRRAWGAALDYAYAGHHWRLSLGLARRARGYWGGARSETAPSHHARLALGFTVPRLGSLSLTWQQRPGDGEEIALTHGRHLWRGLVHRLRVGYTPERGAVAVLWSLSGWLGGGRGAGYSQQWRDGESDERLWIRRGRTPALGPDGYLGLRHTREQTHLDGRLGWDLSRARLELQHAENDAGVQERATLAGSVVFADEHWHLSRPVRDAFAVVRTDGADGVPIRLRRHYVGRTRHGRLLVPGLNAYLRNELRLDSTALPVNLIPERLRLGLVPRYRQGVTASFPLRRVQGVTGTLRDTGGAPRAPDRLVLETPAGERSSVAGKGGRFYLEGLAPGEYTGRLVTQACRFRLRVPASTAVVIDLGAVPCT